MTQWYTNLTRWFLFDENVIKWWPLVFAWGFTILQIDCYYTLLLAWVWLCHSIFFQYSACKIQHCSFSSTLLQLMGTMWRLWLVCIWNWVIDLFFVKHRKIDENGVMEGDKEHTNSSLDQVGCRLFSWLSNGVGQFYFILLFFLLHKTMN